MPKENKELDLELIDKNDVEIEKITKKELDARDEDVPDYKEKVDLTEEQIERLRDEIFKAWDKLKTERSEFESNWDTYDSQYKGEMSDEIGLEFNLNVPVTKVKVDSVERLAGKAFLESDPKFTVTARPSMAKQDSYDVTVTAQSDYLDYKLDEEIPIESPLRKVLHQACKLDVGLMKIPYAHILKKRRREERYSGKTVTAEDGTETNPGLKAFLESYPEAADPKDSGHWVFKDLSEGKDVAFKANFIQTTYSDPLPGFVDCRNFWVDKDTEGYQGLCDARLTIEKIPYTWWELKQAEANGDYENVDDAKTIKNMAEDGSETVDDEGTADYRTRDYEILYCVYNYNMETEDDGKSGDDPEDEIKLICAFDVQSKAYLGATLYPYFGVECFYVPFYIKDKKAGFYKGGMSEDLTDSNLAQNAILNFMLTESWQQLMTTPILREGSPIADQFMHKRFKPGTPILVPRTSLSVSNEIDFLEKPNKGVAVQLMNVLFFLGKYDDDSTGVSSLATGKESPTDPTAPAAKTAMLLKQSGINIGEYINVLAPSFNIVGEIILQLTYQMSNSGRKFRQRQRANVVVGNSPFGEITRDQMIAKTNIQSRAASFDFDKINEKREMLAFWQVARTDPIFARNPEGLYSLARTLTKSWSPLLKNKIDQILPNPQEFKQQQFMIAVQALQVYMQGLQEQAKVTGVEQQPQLQEYMELAAKMMVESITPPPEEKK